MSGQAAPFVSPPDPELERVFSALRGTEKHIPGAIHEAKLLVLAPDKTGRLDITADDVDPEEKSFVGKRIEVNYVAAAGLERAKPLGRPLDIVVDGIDVDIKTSLQRNVMIAPKNIGQILLVIHHDPRKDTWEMGVVRATPALLNGSRTRDKKASLSGAGKQAIWWVASEQPMPAEFHNPLTALPPAVLQAILAERSGQAKLNALFASCLDTPIPRWVVVALGKQLDPAKRVRDSRLKLEPQGIRILSTRYDRPELELLGLNPPEGPGFYFATRRTS